MAQLDRNSDESSIEWLANAKQTLVPDELDIFKQVLALFLEEHEGIITWQIVLRELVSLLRHHENLVETIILPFGTNVEYRRPQGYMLYRESNGQVFIFPLN